MSVGAISRYQPIKTDLQPVPSDESTDDPSEDHNIIEDLSVLLPAPNDPQFQPALTCKHSGIILQLVKVSIAISRVTDASGKFVVVDVGSCGGNSDGGVFSRSSLGKKLMSDKLSIPQRGYIPAPVPNEHLLPRRLTDQNLQKHRQRSTKCGMQVREKLVNYFMTEGAVPWQSNIL
ncbi:hypothetical protein RRG08_003707 [Elysia crispata]|uniref:Uncharacterized protein n=1 Tax=Elysia crispata TaxID=231223 RepID=A0AAE1AVB4_9GAST|nr:hypothetical protein RRG08_003707 [Elysia crispata]